MPTITSLAELARLLERTPQLYVRWSLGPEADADETSRDELTGAELPGLCANPLAVEPWWADRPLEDWVARRLHDYRHLERRRGEGIRPWVLEGTVVGRGPDNEPLVSCTHPVAWVSDGVVEDAEEVVASKRSDWGPLDRSSAS
jgi:hypothetical protein